ncbi:MAG: phytanoyl-CoA dioxygenase family protein, partial [Candidatus Poribacteria bacterium]|nr:phytanoyl-CoA dioxygenase family protein [Candidatus Poribacteria bacterium]
MHTESPFTDCTDMIGNRTQLREHARQNGYLFFPRLLPIEPVLELRRQVLRVSEQHELLAPDTDPDAGIRREGVFICEQDRSETFINFYIDVQKLRLFHALPHHERILHVLEVLFGTSVFIHPRHICHAIFPGEHQYTTPPHQDFSPVRGSQETWTVWTPLGDCDAELGGLAIARGSNRHGLLE